MGWNSGSHIMDTIIENYKAFHGNPIAYHRIEFYMSLIKTFEDYDADTLEECKGTDRWYDVAMLTVELNSPYRDAATKEELAQEITELCQKSQYSSLRIAQNIYEKVYK